MSADCHRCLLSISQEESCRGIIRPPSSQSLDTVPQITEMFLIWLVEKHFQLTEEQWILHQLTDSRRLGFPGEQNITQRELLADRFDKFGTDSFLSTLSRSLKDKYLRLETQQRYGPCHCQQAYSRHYLLEKILYSCLDLIVLLLVKMLHIRRLLLERQAPLLTMSDFDLVRSAQTLRHHQSLISKHFVSFSTKEKYLISIGNFSADC